MNQIGAGTAATAATVAAGATIGVAEQVTVVGKQVTALRRQVAHPSPEGAEWRDEKRSALEGDGGHGDTLGGWLFVESVESALARLRINFDGLHRLDSFSRPFVALCGARPVARKQKRRAKI